MLFGRKKTRLSKEDALAAIPVRNTSVTFSRNASGSVCLTAERQKDWRTKILSSVFQVPKRKTIELDERGSFVWERCDGENNVRNVVQAYRERYVKDKLNYKEAELQVIEFLRMLAQKRLIAMAIVRKEEPGDKTTRGNNRSRK